jgi:hypothetical protein
MHIAAPAFVTRQSSVSIGIEHQKPAVILRAFGTLIWRSSQEHHAIWQCFGLNFALDGQSLRYQLHRMLSAKVHWSLQDERQHDPGIADGLFGPFDISCRPDC